MLHKDTQRYLDFTRGDTPQARERMTVLATAVWKCFQPTSCPMCTRIR